MKIKFIRWSTLLLLSVSVCTSNGDTSTSRAAIRIYPAYELELNLDLAVGNMTARAAIELPASAVTEGSIRLNIAHSGAADMHIQRITNSSGGVLSHEILDSSGVLLVQIGGSPASVNIEYSFTVDSTYHEQFGYYVFANFGETRWTYPRLMQSDDEFFRFGDFAVNFEYPASLGVLTTGGDGQRQQQASRTSAVYTANHVEGFAIVAGEGFLVERHEEEGVAVVGFYHPDYAQKFAKVIQRTKAAAAWYRQTYGFFPLGQVGIIQGHPTYGGGYPLANMFAIHLGNLDDNFLTWITAHELGHYYWGLYVLGDKERLDWIQLALGIWADQYYLAQSKGIAIQDQWRGVRGQGASLIDYLEAMVANHEQQLGLVSENGGDIDFKFDYNSLIRHGKGATGVYLQSLLIGPERFLDLQRLLLKQYRHQPLPEHELITHMEEAGLTGAPAFFEAWKRGDATIGLSIDSVEPDEVRGDWLISFLRTGTVPYPIEVEAESVQGQVVRHTVAANAWRDTLRIPSEPVDIRLDPNGIVPMWNSSHPEMRSAFALALQRAKLDEPFFKLARTVLAETPGDDYLRYRLIRRLYWLARYDEAAALWPSGRLAENRNACIAAIYSARALGGLGRTNEAIGRLEAHRTQAGQHDLLSFWNSVRDAIKE